MTHKLKTLLSIAGSDPLGGAGIQADIRAGAALGLHVLTAVTAVTSQNSKGFYGLGCVEPTTLENQLRAIKEDATPDAIKIGMIGSLDNAKIIAGFLSFLNGEIPVVIDPVLTPTVNSSEFFNNEELIDLYKSDLFPLATVVTPNLKEYDKIGDFSSANAVILKGGHLGGDIIEDKLFTGHKIFTISHHRVECRNLHGTGCVFSSLLAGYLALKYPLKVAFEKTVGSLSEIIAVSVEYILGNSDYGPLNILKNYDCSNK